MWINKIMSVKQPKCAKCYIRAKDDDERLKCSEPFCSDVMGKQQKNTKEKVSLPQKQAQNSSHMSVPPSHIVSTDLF